MLDPAEMAWLDEQMRGDVEHLLVGTSLPFLLPQGLHHLEAFSEALAGGAWGRAVPGSASGSARPSTSSTGAPSSTASARWPDGARGGGGRARGGAAHGHVPLRGRAPQLRVPGVPDPRSDACRDDPPGGLLADPQPAAGADVRVCQPAPGRVGGWSAARQAARCRSPAGLAATGPWFDNNLATLEVTGGGLSMRWLAGDIEGRATDEPVVKVVAEVGVPVQPAGAGTEPGMTAGSQPQVSEHAR